jgi:hypothetical protein
MLRKTTDISVTTYAQQQSVERRETYGLTIHTISKFLLIYLGHYHEKCIF